MVGMLDRMKTVRELDKKHIQRRALIDLLKFLRDQGLTTNFQGKLQHHIVESQLIEPDDTQVKGKLSNYYFKAHECLLMMQETSQVDESSDIKNPDIIRMQGLS